MNNFKKVYLQTDYSKFGKAEQAGMQLLLECLGFKTRRLPLGKYGPDLEIIDAPPGYEYMVGDMIEVVSRLFWPGGSWPKPDFRIEGRKIPNWGPDSEQDPNIPPYGLHFLILSSPESGFSDGIFIQQKHILANLENIQQVKHRLCQEGQTEPNLIIPAELGIWLSKSEPESEVAA